LAIAAVVGAGAQLAGEQRQQARADGDADHAERQLAMRSA
jgi:hypothetical protein